MSILKKLLLLKNEAGLALIGLLFAVIGGAVFLSDPGELMPLCFLAIGVILFLVGLVKVIRELKTPARSLSQYDKIDARAVPPAEPVQDTAEGEEDFVFHFTGKGNQSYVMKDAGGTPVYEATTDKLLMVKARPFVFRNCMNGQETTHAVSGTVTTSVGGNGSFGGVNIRSTFRIDGQDVWDQIAAQGYGFTFSMNKLAAHYEVRHWNRPAGFAELGGTGLMDPRYRDNPLGKVPTNGIFKVRCRRSDVPAFFLICFAVTLTELTLE